MSLEALHVYNTDKVASFVTTLSTIALVAQVLSTAAGMC